MPGSSFGSPKWVQVQKDLCHLLLLPTVNSQGAVLQAERLMLELVFIQDASAADGGFTGSVTMLALAQYRPATGS